MPVAEDRRRAFGTRGRGDLADGERPLAPGHHVRGPTRAADGVRDPGGGLGDSALVIWVGADGRDGDQLGELLDELLQRRHVHARESIHATRASG